MDCFMLDVLEGTSPSLDTWRKIQSIRVRNNCCEVWENGEGHIIVVFCTSDDSHDWLSNARFLPRLFVHPHVRTPMLVHTGFTTVLQALQPSLDLVLAKIPIRRLSICGFSMGGALAVLYGYLVTQQRHARYPVDVLSIAAPVCIGDDRFNRAVNATAGLSIRNIVFPRDPITTLIENVVGRPYARNEKIVVYLASGIPKGTVSSVLEGYDGGLLADLGRFGSNIWDLHSRSIYIPAIRAHIGVGASCPV